MWQIQLAGASMPSQAALQAKRVAPADGGHYGWPMATFGDVTLRAGVSAVSMSRALDHPAKVSGGVRERVTRAMGELGYVRDGAACALASRQPVTIGHVATLGIGTGQVRAAAGSERHRRAV